MSKLNSCKGKHLNLEGRIFIEYTLDEQYTLKEIAKRVGKDPTTISKEIKRNRVLSSKKNRTEFLRSINQKSWRKKQLCRATCTNLCKKCTMINCYRHCLEYSTKKCVKLDRFPYVCNGCTTASMCQNERYQYRSKVAEANYKEILKSSREGLNTTPVQLKNLDELISPLIIKGQSISHIYANHTSDINCSERTIYKYFEQNIFNPRIIDLPRKVKLKPRKKLLHLQT